MNCSTARGSCGIGFAAAALSACALLAGAPSVVGQNLPSGFAESLVVGGLPSNLTAMAFAPDGRLFLCQQSGNVLVIKGGALLPNAFVSIAVDDAGERGLVGIVFDPNFDTNGYVYLYYTARTASSHNRVSRFTTDPSNPDVALPNSEYVVTSVDPLSATVVHNGGGIAFGPDGKLYVAVGDNANSANAQSMSTRKGKVLRLNKDGSIPIDNPFFADPNVTGDNKAIWALGFRNPFTCAFQPGTGHFFVNDVGANLWEEIDAVVAGANYGWPACEGYCSPPNAAYTDPVFAYPHASDETSGCSIGGGAFYNPAVSQFPAEYVGKYFFIDFCNRWIRVLDPAVGSATAFESNTAAYSLATTIGPDGCLYYLSRGIGGTGETEGAGGIYKIRFTGLRSAQIGQHPVSQTIPEGKPITFVVRVSGDAPISYQWQRNGVNINGATSSKLTISSVKLSDNNAQFRCIARNSFGTATSNAATLTVVSNQSPTCAIDLPVEGTLYSGGSTINYSGSATDPEDGALAASAYTWQVDFHHDDHFHPFIAATSGAKSGSFTVPTTGETADNVWYRIRLTVKDAVGATSTAYRDVMPHKITLSLGSTPSGLELTLDGSPVTTPFSTLAVSGITRTLGVTSPQTAGGTTYVFDSWSDGGAASHDIATPQSDTTYIARFVSEATPTPTPAPALDASFESQVVPSTMVAGQSYDVAVTMKNTGGSTWSYNERHKLGSENPRDNLTWGLSRVRLPASPSVPPGSTHTFNFKVTAPSTEGGYNFQWRMLQEGVVGGWFGAKTPNVLVNVQSPATASNASFQSQNVPTTMAAGQSYKVSVTMTNTGQTTWTFGNAYKIGTQNPRDNTVWGLSRVRLPFNGSVAPNASHTFEFDVTAPSAPGTYNFQWQMLRETSPGFWFGERTPNVAVFVQ